MKAGVSSVSPSSVRIRDEGLTLETSVFRMNKRARKHGRSERTKGWKGKLTQSMGNSRLWAIYANFLVYLSYLCKRMFKTWTSCYNIVILDEVVMQTISDQLTLMMEPTPSLYSSEVTLNMTSPSDNPAQFSKKENSKLL